MGTFYGHGSSIALVIFLALFALRMLASQRRRQGRSRAPVPGSSITDTAPPMDTAAADRAPDGAGGFGQVTFTGIAPGWLIDPTGRHEKRYWSGSEWTEHVSDGGVPGTDPPPGGSGRDTPT